MENGKREKFMEKLIFSQKATKNSKEEFMSMENYLNKMNDVI